MEKNKPKRNKRANHVFSIIILHNSLDLLLILLYYFLILCVQKHLQWSALKRLRFSSRCVFGINFYFLPSLSFQKSLAMQQCDKTACLKKEMINSNPTPRIFWTLISYNHFEQSARNFRIITLKSLQLSLTMFASKTVWKI